MEQKLKTAVRIISDGCECIRELRKIRIGSRTTQVLIDELRMLNRAISASDDTAHRGRLLAQKALWFNQDKLLSELGIVRGMINAVQRCINDNVLDKIASKRYDVSRARGSLQEVYDQVKLTQDTVLKHEAMLAHGLEGRKVSHDELAELEEKITSSHTLIDAISSAASDTAKRIAQHPDFSKDNQHKMAAALVLAMASAAKA